jgi:hypothetical protein
MIAISSTNYSEYHPVELITITCKLRHGIEGFRKRLERMHSKRPASEEKGQGLELRQIE